MCVNTGGGFTLSERGVHRGVHKKGGSQGVHEKGGSQGVHNYRTGCYAVATRIIL